MTEGFWKVVAERIGTGHSARECSNKYAQLSVKSYKNKGARKNVAAVASGMYTIDRHYSLSGFHLVVGEASPPNWYVYN